MLSIEQAYERQTLYSGNERVKRAISETALIAFVAATAAGKNFLMEASGLPIAGNVTTRAPRRDDHPDRYTYTDLPDMLTQIEEGNYVQYGVSLPENIYATRVEDYKLGSPNAKDIWHDAIISLDNKGFKDVRSISVLTPKPQWISQLTERFEGMPVGNVQLRLSEAKHSIRWSRAQHLSGAANHLIIINRDDNVKENVEKIAAFAHGEDVERPDTEEVQAVAEEMNKAIDIMYGRLGA